jgi:hypothetical protein
MEDVAFEVSTGFRATTRGSVYARKLSDPLPVPVLELATGVAAVDPDVVDPDVVDPVMALLSA